MTQNDAPAHDILLQYTADAMLRHATEVAVLRRREAGLERVAQAAFDAIQRLSGEVMEPETAKAVAAAVPGFTEWAAAKGAAP